MAAPIARKAKEKEARCRRGRGAEEEGVRGREGRRRGERETEEEAVPAWSHAVLERQRNKDTGCERIIPRRTLSRRQELQDDVDCGEEDVLLVISGS
ncbi:hypothetical protein KM043_009661 [Ampulex compressa]|nr:hypothetical protein KM043_009661 [Ampulex compressa]